MSPEEVSKENSNLGWTVLSKKILLIFFCLLLCLVVRIKCESRWESILEVGKEA